MRIALDGIDRRLGRPLHEQLASVIRGAILEGHYRPGERIEPEREFMRVSRLSYRTVARAFRNLAAEGLVVRRVGSGTFISGDVPAEVPARRTIGVVHHIHSDFFTSIFAGIRSESQRRSFLPLPLIGGGEERDEDRVLRELQEYKVAGILAIPNLYIRRHRELMRLVIRRMPVVLIDTYLPEVACDGVASDNEEASYQLARHLLDLGHERIVYLTHTILYPYATTVQDRLSGMERALEERGVDLSRDHVVRYPIADERETKRHVQLAVSKLLALPPDERPTAIMCVTDRVATLLLRLLRKAGLSVPRDMSVTAFDDNLAPYSDPPLTTAVQPLERIGRQSVCLLFNRLAHPEKQPTRLILDAPIVVRESTAPPPLHKS